MLELVADMQLTAVTRFLLGAALAVFILAVSIAVAPSGAAAAANSCSDSWGADGHSGPWYTGSNQTLHGNSLVISCPLQTTTWSIRYMVIKFNPNDLTQSFTPIDETRSGHGDASFSISINPIGCNVSPWRYETRVHNIVTGGNITKPANGLVIC